MLTGAARAARTAGVFRLERVWVVAVPVVMMLVLERLLTFYFIFWSMRSFWISHPYAELAGRPGPWSMRTALVTTSFAVTGYALLWAVRAVVEYVREVRRHGRRLLLRGGATGRLVVFGSMFLILAYETTVVASLPTAADVLAAAEADSRSQSWWRFTGAVLHDVPGIRRFCRENLDHASRPHRLAAAMALTRLRAGSNRTVALLRSITREEFLDRRNVNLFRRLEQISTGRAGLFPFRLMYLTPGEQEELWQRFRREHIP